VALVAAVAGLAVVATLAVAVAQWSLASTRLASSMANTLQVEALLRSGVTIAATLLEERVALGEPDTLAGLLGPTPVTYAIGPGSIELRFEDAARRLDLGAPDLAAAVRRLFRALALPAELGDTLADWTDADDTPRPHGAERDWYLARTPPLLPANAPLGAVSELGVVRGYDAETLARLEPFVATAGERAVNPNTAPPEVLAAWLGSDDTAFAMLARRTRTPVPCAGMPACTTRSDAYLVHVVAVVHGVRGAVTATLWVPPMGPAEVRAVRPSAAQERRQSEDLT
jgi:general secretion pathway protein K